MELSLIGLVMMVAGAVLLWFLSGRKTSPFPERFRDLIESYVSVLISVLVVLGLMLVAIGFLDAGTVMMKP